MYAVKIKAIRELADMGIETDLILFHPYDRWGFASMTAEENEIYLRFALRRLAAYPSVWWSMANEYDLCFSKTAEDWAGFEEIIKEEDPYGHLLSNHYCMKPYDNSRENITHLSMQNILFYKAPQWIREYKKPLIYDECCYEGNIHLSWGNISAEEIVHRFWCAYCGHCGEKAFIKYYGIQQPARSCMFLPKEQTYRLELIDTRARKKSVITEGVSGVVRFDMPGKEKMAVLAVAEDRQSEKKPGLS